MAKVWKKKGYVTGEFVNISPMKIRYHSWSMIDKITPRPAESVCRSFWKNLALRMSAPVITAKNTYIAPFVNAEGPQYLVIEDHFPNGRPALEKAGVYMTDRDTVNKVERMKATTCLTIAYSTCVYGCVLGYTLIADEMKDEELNRFVQVKLHPVEGMLQVTDPAFIAEAFCGMKLSMCVFQPVYA